MENIINDIEQLKKVSTPILILDENKLGHDPEGTEEFDQIKAKLINALNENPDLLSISAPQLGIYRRIFAIRFSDGIRIFLDPLIKKRSVDKFVSFERYLCDPDKFVYICRPKEIEIVYFDENLKYEDNKFSDIIAAEFMKQYSLLDGIIPAQIFEINDFTKELNEENMHVLVDATYSGGGFVFTKQELDEDGAPDLEEVAETLEKMTNIYQSTVAKLLESDDLTKELKELLKNFMIEERFVLGLLTMIDQEQYRREKHQRYVLAQQKKAKKQADLKSFMNKKRR